MGIVSDPGERGKGIVTTGGGGDPRASWRSPLPVPRRVEVKRYLIYSTPSTTPLRKRGRCRDV